MNIWVPQKAGNFLTSWVTVSSSRRALLDRVSFEPTLAKWVGVLPWHYIVSWLRRTELEPLSLWKSQISHVLNCLTGNSRDAATRKIIVNLQKVNTLRWLASAMDVSSLCSQSFITACLRYKKKPSRLICQSIPQNPLCQILYFQPYLLFYLGRCLLEYDAQD